MEPVIDEPPDFTPEQMSQALKEIGEDVRKQAVAAGLPVSFVRDNLLILKYPDGREEIIETLETKTGEVRRELL